MSKRPVGTRPRSGDATWRRTGTRSSTSSRVRGATWKTTGASAALRETASAGHTAQRLPQDVRRRPQDVLGVREEHARAAPQAASPHRSRCSSRWHPSSTCSSDTPDRPAPARATFTVAGPIRHSGRPDSTRSAPTNRKPCLQWPHPSASGRLVTRNSGAVPIRRPVVAEQLVDPHVGAVLDVAGDEPLEPRRRVVLLPPQELALERSESPPPSARCRPSAPCRLARARRPTSRSSPSTD